MALARLCLESKDKVGKIRDAVVRTILDLQDIADSEGFLEFLASNSGVKLSLIQVVCQSNRNEQSITRLRKVYDVLNRV